MSSQCARSSAIDPVLLRAVAVCGRVDMCGRMNLAMAVLRSEQVEMLDTLETVLIESSSRHESVSLAASAPHQWRGEWCGDCIRLPVGVLAILIATVDLFDIAEKSESSPRAEY